MNAITRRKAIKVIGVATISTILFPSLAVAEGFLRGTWIVRCPNGHDDQVDDITRNHDCEKCGAKAVDGGTANVVCPDGHATRVTGVTESHLCSYPLPGGGTCGKQARRG